MRPEKIKYSSSGVPLRLEDIPITFKVVTSALFGAQQTWQVGASKSELSLSKNAKKETLRFQHDSESEGASEGATSCEKR